MKSKYLGVLTLVFSTYALAEPKTLHETMLALDTELFSSFNNCESEQELMKHSRYFDPEVEFYHDNGGVTWDRDTMIEKTRANACGNFTRELVVDTFTSHPIKDFGAITKGVHRFCQIGSDVQSSNKVQVSACEGTADFVMVWRNTDNKWRVTRVLSFGHRAND